MRRIARVVATLRSSPMWPVKFALLYAFSFSLLLANSCRVNEEIPPDALATAAVAIPTYDAAFDAYFAAVGTAEAIIEPYSLELLATEIAINPVAGNYATATAIADLRYVLAPLVFAAATQEAAFYNIPEPVLRATATGSVLDTQAFAWRRDPKGKPPAIQTAIVAYGDAFSATLRSSGPIPPATRTPIMATIVAFSTVDAALVTAYVTETEENDRREQLGQVVALLWESPLGIILIAAVAFLVYGVKLVTRKMQTWIRYLEMSDTKEDGSDVDEA